MNDCIFCKIVSGEIPSYKVYEDKDTFAFLDIHPLHPGHTLVIPKVHSRNILEISAEDYKAVASTCRIVAKAIKESLPCDGVNVSMNNESASGQDVFHAHVHIMPRYKDDGFLPWHKPTYPNEEFESAGEKIKKNLI